jgi:hypothetical protein
MNWSSSNLSLRTQSPPLHADRIKTNGKIFIILIMGQLYDKNLYVLEFYVLSSTYMVKPAQSARFSWTFCKINRRYFIKFHLGSAEVEEYDYLNEEMAIQVVDILLKKEISCSVNELLSQNPATCHRLRTGTTCEVLTKIGYFLIHRSAYGSFDHNIIWTRWD